MFPFYFYLFCLFLPFMLILPLERVCSTVFSHLTLSLNASSKFHGFIGLSLQNESIVWKVRDVGSLISCKFNDRFHFYAPIPSVILCLWNSEGLGLDILTRREVKCIFVTLYSETGFFITFFSIWKYLY